MVKARFKRSVICEEGEFRIGQIYEIPEELADKLKEYIEIVKVETEPEPEGVDKEGKKDTKKVVK